MRKNVYRIVRTAASVGAIAIIISACAPSAPVSSPAPPESSPVPAAVPATPEPPPPPQAPKGPVFETANLIITPSEVDAGSPVTVKLTVSNTGDEPGSTNITLKMDGSTADTKEVRLSPGTSQELSFTRYGYTSRTYSISVDNLSGTFKVRYVPPPSPPPAITPPPPAPSASAVRDFSWDEVRSFLKSDNATVPLRTSAPKAGIRIGKASLKFRTGTLTVNTFNTTDYGIVYVDDRKANGEFVVWSVDVNSYFFRGLPASRIDIRYLNDQAWWFRLTEAYGQQITTANGEKLWDAPIEVTVTW